MTYGKRLHTSTVDDSAEGERLFATLKQLLSLFDFVIREDYTPEHASLPTIIHEASNGSPTGYIPSTPGARRGTRPHKSSPTAKSPPAELLTGDSCNLACDFCGADVFQSFFECNECTPNGSVPDSSDLDDDDDMYRPSTRRPTLGDGLILCPGCYAEGRTCECGYMHAAQCRSFASLLKTRNEAAAVLNSARDLFGPDKRGTAELRERYVDIRPFYECALRNGVQRHCQFGRSPNVPCRVHFNEDA